MPEHCPVACHAGSGFEQAIILTLIALIMLVTAIATIHLISAVWHLVVAEISQME